MEKPRGNLEKVLPREDLKPRDVPKANPRAQPSAFPQSVPQLNLNMQAKDLERMEFAMIFPSYTHQI